MLAPDTILQTHYHVVRQIGQGGMGTVYEATDLCLDNTVALKQMLMEQVNLGHIGLLRRAFEREAHLLAGLRHPALPHVIDHFDDPAGQFLKSARSTEYSAPTARAPPSASSRPTAWTPTA